MCDWPTTIAAKTDTVCGVVKLNVVYLTELAKAFILRLFGFDCAFLIPLPAEVQI